MYCTNCGTENSDGATFCNQCGAQLAIKQSMSQQTVTNPKVPKSLIIGIVVAIIVCGVMAPVLLSKNKGKGAGNLDEIARSVVLCYGSGGDMSYIEDYFEEGANKDSYIEYYQNRLCDRFFAGIDGIDMDSITYNVEYEFEENNCTYSRLAIRFFLPGLGKDGGFGIDVYKKGKKWFLFDGQKPQE